MKTKFQDYLLIVDFAHYNFQFELIQPEDSFLVADPGPLSPDWATLWRRPDEPAV